MWQLISSDFYYTKFGVAPSLEQKGRYLKHFFLNPSVYLHLPTKGMRKIHSKVDKQ